MSVLLFLSGPSEGLRHELSAEVTLGRSPSCELPLDDDKDSRRHARIWLHETQARIADLQSRNGTLINGEKLLGEAVLLAGDRIQIGETTLLFDPPTPAAFADSQTLDAQFIPIAEVLPHVGVEAMLYSVSSRLFGATSEAMVLRRAADELLKIFNVDRSAALLAGAHGLLTAAVAGGSRVEVPRHLAKAALERRELARSGTALCAPIAASGGATPGILYVERAEAMFTVTEGRWLATIGRLVGDAYAAVRTRASLETLPAQLVGASPRFGRMLELVRRAALNATPTLLLGTDGSGKREAARFIHLRSARALAPFVAVDCRQAPPALEEELFGRASGTGSPAVSSAFLRADGGSLLLHHAQLLPRGMLERVAKLVGRKVAPAREGGEEPVDLRLLVSADAAHREAMLGAESPLQALLRESEIEVPPLREREEDVFLLFEHFVQRGVRAATSAKPTLTPAARLLMRNYAWPHNVRELALIAERLALIYPGGEVDPLRLPPELQLGEVVSDVLSLEARVVRLEREAIAEALRVAGGKKVRAAELLGISRPTLDKKISGYGILVEKVRRS